MLIFTDTKLLPPHRKCMVCTLVTMLTFMDGPLATSSSCMTHSISLAPRLQEQVILTVILKCIVIITNDKASGIYCRYKYQGIQSDGSIHAINLLASDLFTVLYGHMAACTKWLRSEELCNIHTGLNIISPYYTVIKYKHFANRNLKKHWTYLATDSIFPASKACRICLSLFVLSRCQ